MSEQHNPEDAGSHTSGVSPVLLNLLEGLDNIAHVVVAFFFIVLAASVIVYASMLLVRDVPLIFEPQHKVAASNESAIQRPTGTEEHAVGGENKPGETAEVPAASRTAHETEDLGPSQFLHKSLELLSTLLFVVIVLELLKTIITYLKTHNIQAIMKEFLVVGIISSIRKILLVGAESSLGSADPTSAYIKEASGTVITIAGILLLIAGLIFLQRSENGPAKE
jgi:uncharacterized membrane protein (DUF373 family)